MTGWLDRRARGHRVPDRRNRLLRRHRGGQRVTCDSILASTNSSTSISERRDRQVGREMEQYRLTSRSDGVSTKSWKLQTDSPPRVADVTALPTTPATRDREGERGSLKQMLSALSHHRTIEPGGDRTSTVLVRRISSQPEDRSPTEYFRTTGLTSSDSVFILLNSRLLCCANRDRTRMPSVLLCSPWSVRARP